MHVQVGVTLSCFIPVSEWDSSHVVSLYTCVYSTQFLYSDKNAPRALYDDRWQTWKLKASLDSLCIPGTGNLFQLNVLELLLAVEC